MRTRHTLGTRLLAAIAGTGLALAMAGATASAADNEKTTNDADPSSVLRGPDVEDRDVPGASSSFGDSDMKPAQDKERRVGHRAFMRAVHGLESEDAPSDLRATEAQLDEVRAIETEFRDAQRAYMDGHRAEIRELMGQIRPRGGAESDKGQPRERGRRGQRGEPGQRATSDNQDGAPGQGRRGRGGPDADRPDGPPQGERGRGRGMIDPESLTAEQRAAFERVKEIRAAGPQPEAYHARIWEVLSAEQRGFVEVRLVEIVEQGQDAMRERREQGDRRPREEGQRKRGADPDKART